MATLTGTLAYSKAYDNAAYLQPDPQDFPALTGASALSQKFISFTARQLKSVSVVPTTAGTSNDVLQLVQVTTLPVNFVGVTGTASFATGTSTVTLTNLGTFGSGATAPQYLNLSQGTFTITVVNGTTTSTATNVTLGSGVNGGLSVGALDQYWIKKGTDATVVYVGEIEGFFTPGTSFTL